MTMKHVCSALWRIDFNTNATLAGAPSIPLGYMLEAHWESDVCWLGLLYRRSLTPLELERINLETWPELQSTSKFLKDLFHEAFDIGTSDQMGSEVIAKRFNQYSAVRFSREALSIEVPAFSGEDSFEKLYGHVMTLKSKLEPHPSLLAPVIKLKPRQKAPPVPLDTGLITDVA